MKIVIETYRLLQKMGPYKAYSTVEIVEMTGKQRCAVLKRLHRLEKAGIMEKRTDSNGSFYWKVLNMPARPIPPKVWIEPKSVFEKTGKTSDGTTGDDDDEESTESDDVSSGLPE